MVSRDQKDRDAAIGDLEERFERGGHQTRRDLGPVEQVATVNHRVDLASKGGLKGGSGVGEEIRAAPPALGPRTSGQIKTEVGIGKKQERDHRLSLSDKKTRRSSPAAADRTGVDPANPHVDLTGHVTFDRARFIGDQAAKVGPYLFVKLVDRDIDRMQLTF